ncbi:hypothetical protein K439DRAFT_1559869 [Ramaria rubella]|nr:hypothetical protein K439DRAFT_1559869 [Ramaria rubella]
MSGDTSISQGWFINLGHMGSVTKQAFCAPINEDSIRSVANTTIVKVLQNSLRLNPPSRSVFGGLNKKVVFVRRVLDERLGRLHGGDNPAVTDCHKRLKKELYSDKENFIGCWSILWDNVLKRDMDWVKKSGRGTEDVETWMWKVGYTGSFRNILKLLEDREKTFCPKLDGNPTILAKVGFQCTGMY